MYQTQTCEPELSAAIHEVSAGATAYEKHDMMTSSVALFFLGLGCHVSNSSISKSAMP